MAATKDFLFADAVPEKSTYLYDTLIDDPTGLPLDPGSVSSIRMWLRDLTSDTIVNSRSDVEVLNQNGGVLTTGRFTFQFTSDDTAYVWTGSLTLPRGTAEKRALTLDFHLIGAGRVTHKVTFYVRGFRDIA